MRTTSRCVIVLVTAPDLKIARSLGRLALEQSLAACVNIVPRIESHYRWKGRLEKSAEVLLVIKTTRLQLKRLEAAILSGHPYDTPEFVVLPLSGGSGRYVDWLVQSVAARPEPGEKT